MWNEKDYASWLLRYMEEEKIEKCFLLGHSNSGPIAIEFANRHPQKVLGIILADTIGVEKRSYFKTLFGRLIDGFIEVKLTLWGFYQLAWNFFVHMPNFIFQIRAAMETDVLEDAKKLKVPVLILWGNRDHTIPLHLGRKLHENVPKSKLHICGSGSHDWLITHADESSRVILDWASRYSQRIPDILQFKDEQNTFNKPSHIVQGHRPGTSSNSKGYFH